MKGRSFLKLFFAEFSKKAKLMQQELDYYVNNTRNLDACGQQVITFYIISIFIKLFLSNVKILLFLGVFSQCGRKVFQKANISYLLIPTRMCAYQGVSNVSFSENFAQVLSE